VYSSSANAIKSGRHRKIQDGTPEAKIVYDIIEQGLGSTSATFVLNAYFTRQGSPEKQVSLHAVKNFIKDNPCVIITRNTGGKGTRYFRKVVGDSPELCRGLDSHGFADLVRSMVYHTVLTSSYALDDTRRFKLGTPAEVEDCMRRCWTLEPTSSRIVEDVVAFERVLRLIVEAKGCVVPDEATRSGRRARKANAPPEVADAELEGKHWCKKKPRLSQRKSTIQQTAPVTHADAQAALDNLMGDDFDAIMELIPGVASTFGV
jgi:hypothetical protein